MEKLNKQNLVMMEEETRQMRKHLRKIKKSWFLNNIKEYSFPQRTADIWNGLKEKVVRVTYIHEFMELLDIWRYGNKT